MGKNKKSKKSVVNSQPETKDEGVSITTKPVANSQPETKDEGVSITTKPVANSQPETKDQGVSITTHNDPTEELVEIMSKGPWKSVGKMLAAEPSTARFFSPESSRSARSPPRPTPEYLALASRPPIYLTFPQPLLVILDLNGTLLHRANRLAPHDFVPRPYLGPFISYILSCFSVMVWSSARPENVSSMCKKLFMPRQRRRVVQEWGRDKLGLNKYDYNRKVQVYKRLDTVWEDREIQSAHPSFVGGKQGFNAYWNSSNTVLIDDSRLKAASQPWSIVEVPEFKAMQMTKWNEGEGTLREVATYLEAMRWHADVTSFMREYPFVVGDRWGGRSPLDDHE